ncbi:MAG: hypothetical protein K6G33_04105 [Ruminococcus sp.]|uniref:hypothetical protein n=1 Tax=Ruminococcus sp. TaxID=41978 RepID=UPI0025D9DCF3|nr:hypothetical protein [Ruminococcus sp.]MCR5599911.1 hypothetical protein [Ruminococcus sp.]
MKRKILASVAFTAAFALTVTASCSDNNTDDYLYETTTTEVTTTEEPTTATTKQHTTEATTEAKKEYPELVNTYSGTYVATQGVTALDFSVFGTDDDGVIQALFSFHEDPSNTGVPSGSYLMEGTVDEEKSVNGVVAVDFKGSKWDKKPETYSIIEFKAYFDPENGIVKSDKYELKLKKTAGADLGILVNRYEGEYTPEAGEKEISFDIVNVGNHGDIEAVFEFEPEKGKKVSFISEGQVSNIASDGRITASFTGIEWSEEVKDKKYIDFEGVFSADGRTLTENGGHNIKLAVK